MLNQTRSSRSSNCSSKAIIYLLVQLTTLVLNFIAALTLWRLKDHKANISHLVVRVLVVSDVFGSVISMTPILISCSGTAVLNGLICNIFGYLSSVFLLWTALIVLLLCTLRYLALVRPLFYRTYLTYRIVLYVLLCQFIWSTSHMLLPLVGIGRFKFYSEGQYCAFEIKPSGNSDTVLVHITVWEGWLTILALLFFVVRMLYELRVKKKLASRLSFQQRRGVQASGSRQQGYTLMTVVIVAIFMICYIPFLMFRMLALITKHINEAYHYHLHLLANLNPLVNPVIYVAFNKSYRKSVQRLLERFCCCCKESFLKLSKSGSISMVLFSTSSDEANQNAGDRQRSASSFLTVPSFLPRAIAPSNDGRKIREFGHRRCFSDGLPSTGTRAKPKNAKTSAQTSFSEKLSRRQRSEHAQVNKAFDTGHLHIPPGSPTGKPRGLSVSSIAAVVGTRDEPRIIWDDPDDDVFLPGTAQD